MPSELRFSASLLTELMLPIRNTPTIGTITVLIIMILKRARRNMATQPSRRRSSADISKIEISAEKINLETVPRAFFDDMAFNLSEALGPIAPVSSPRKSVSLGNP